MPKCDQVPELARLLLAALPLLAGGCAPERPPSGFDLIFDGATLVNWRAVPERLAATWSVEDGAIQGRGLEDEVSYLAYAADEALGNFELRLSYRMLTDGNTGVEIRARRDATGKRPFEGYHADIGHVGIGPQILGAWDLHFATREEFPCPRGSILSIDRAGMAQVKPLDRHVDPSDIAVRDWNQCRIVAQGNHFQFYMNGIISSELVDEADDGQLRRGIVALQIHEKGTTVQFKDIAMRRLP